jgi:hypothetical protein
VHSQNRKRYWWKTSPDRIKEGGRKGIEWDQNRSSKKNEEGEAQLNSEDCITEVIANHSRFLPSFVIPRPFVPSSNLSFDSAILRQFLQKASTDSSPTTKTISKSMIFFRNRKHLDFSGAVAPPVRPTTAAPVFMGEKESVLGLRKKTIA